ncbi:unnamed protein product [Ilex paraguariensis]|uniref:Alpha 1,4-glycosyltransferase domain-containing protein n=1 Tax=Ilex paraguariensis TaxID=185542 RepID=A0ABC8R586_9AQUA
MLPNPRPRRRTRHGAQLCAISAALLLLISVSLLHSRLGFDRHSQHPLPINEVVSNSDLLLEDTDPEDRNSNTNSDDRIDELDDVVLNSSNSNSNLEVDEEFPTGADAEEEEEINQSRVSGFFYDHINGVVRRAINKRNIDEWEDYVNFDSNSLRLGLGLESGNENENEKSEGVFGSDDTPVDESIRNKVGEVKSIEDVLLLKVGSKVSPLREGWGEWFDKKSDFLRRDRMFKSNLEHLNPLNYPMLQDPDGSGVTRFTRGDRLVQKGLLNEFKKVPFLGKKTLGIVEEAHESKTEWLFKSKSELVEDGVGKVIKEEKNRNNVNVKGKEIEGADERRSGMKMAEGRALDDNDNSGLSTIRIIDSDKVLNVTRVANFSFRSDRSDGIQKQNAGAHVRIKSEFSGQVYADGKRWGYYPGLHAHLSFSNFMDAFFRKGKCSMRVFMMWNSPPWTFSVRYQRGLESLLFHHRDACVVVFSEAIELNFFNGFVKDGFKVAVAMPNLEELLKDTPTHIFASVWFEWKKTKFYPTHYSELVRLAALYKYGGIYLDFDIVVLKPLSSLNNTIGLEDVLARSPMNGAVMAFRKHRYIKNFV